MASKEQGVAKSAISPVLFMTVDGEPMSFFLRPGPLKCKLQPLITAGGGLLCKVQQPGVILLIDPTEEGSVTETTAHRYVSTQYVYDCVEMKEQLNVEDYKLNPASVKRHSTRLSNNRESYATLSGGRLAYTPEDDAAILSFVGKHMKEIGGNRLWQEMQRQRVTGHSWQSMKYRYRARLAKKQSEAGDEPTTESETKAPEEENEVDKNPETECEKPSTAEDAAPPTTHDTESDSKQIDVPPASDEDTQLEIVEDEQTAENTVEADTAKPPQPEVPCLDPPTESHPLPAESTDADETQSLTSPHKASLTADSPQPQPASVPEVPSLEESQEIQLSPLRPEPPRRRSTRRQLPLDNSSRSYNDGSQSVSTAEPPPPSPKRSKKAKPSVQSPQRHDTAAEEPPSKKARGESVMTVAEVHQEESRQAADPETTQIDAESVSVPQKEGKKKEKRKLGILEMATKEFESESEDDRDPSEQNQVETAKKNPTETLAAPSTSAIPASSETNCRRGPDLQKNVQENLQQNVQENVQENLQENVQENLQQNVQENVQENMQEAQASPSISHKAAAGGAVSAASKAHLFIFDSESQENESQSILCDRAAVPDKPQQTDITDSAQSLSQIQLEGDKQRIRRLMKETNQDLASVTKALLKTSGNFSEARALLLDLLPFSGTLWQCCDDDLLTSGDLTVRQQLQEKYGEEVVAKRVVFLELEQ